MLKLNSQQIHKHTGGKKIYSVIYLLKVVKDQIKSKNFFIRLYTYWENLLLPGRARSERERLLDSLKQVAQWRTLINESEEWRTD